MIERILALVIGYIFGNFIAGNIICKVKHVDVTKMGSGNPGATNINRTLGPGWGLLTLFLDALKVWIAAIVVAGLVGDGICYTQFNYILAAYTAIGTVIGNNFPIPIQKGGKGVSATTGAMILLDWRIFIICLLVFVLVVAITKYVSLASMLSSVTMLGAWIIFYLCGISHMAEETIVESIILVGILTLLVFQRHKENIVRLKNGTENKFSVKRR